MISIYGNGVMIAYFIFLGDFMPKLISDFGGHPDRTVLLLLAAALVLPFMLQGKMGILAKMTPIAILALAYTAVVIIAKSPQLYEEHAGFGNEPEMVVLDWNVFKSSSICIFAYNCHLNVVPIACRLKEPSRQRIAGVCSAAVLIQCVFYVLIAVSGYISFMKDTQQDILQSFTKDDRFLMVSRLLLTLSILIGIPVNFHPTVQSTMDLIQYFRPPPVAACGPALIDSSEVPATPGSQYCRSIIVILCVALQITLAIKVPEVASVISLLGATCGTIMMFAIPAVICRRKILSGEEDTWQARVSCILLISVTLVSCVGIVVLFQ
jgi:amino acid permease